MSKFRKQFLSLSLLSSLVVGWNGANPCLAQENTSGAGTVGGAPAGTSAPARASEANDAAFCQKADAVVAQRVRELNLPGYAIGVIRDGKVIFKKGYGVTDENGSPVQPDTVFGLASVTKTFTALALLSLVDQGKINLDDPLEKYVKVSKAYQPLTIRQLASMTAGVPRGIPNEVPWPEEFKIIQEQPLLFAPGSEYQYSNCSYRTLGTVIEHVAGKPYLEVLKELIFQPLGMTSSGTQLGISPQKLAWPFSQKNPQAPVVRLEPYRDPAIPFAAGMLFSNIDDMLKYAQALMNKQIVSPAAYQTMWQSRPPLTTGKPSPWAFGWSCNPKAPAYGNRYLVSMNGGVPGVASTIQIFPDEKVAVVSLCNLRKKVVGQIAHKVAQIYWGTDSADAPKEEPAEGTASEPGGESQQAIPNMVR